HKSTNCLFHFCLSDNILISSPPAPGKERRQPTSLTEGVRAGLYHSITMFLVAYFIITMTVLSICAISTNGALEAGGAYCILFKADTVDCCSLKISLGILPFWGFSIMFFLANVCGCALFVLGLMEAIMSTFGVPEGSHQIATIIIFIIVFTVLVSIFISFFTVGPPVLILPETSLANNTSRRTANYTGLWLCTLKGNLFCKCQISLQTYFDRLFAVLFNGCSGIMAGSSMSGIVIYSIPRGMLAAVLTTFIAYNLLSLLAAGSCDCYLFQRDYSVLGDINVWLPMVTVGIYSSAMSAAMSNLLGASRILYALAKDNLLDENIKHVLLSGNPWVSELICWFLVQVNL
uniref:Amino acid permease/ SLC12A domain-containing protein n=1 Tax=Xiphophorus maculatus TaxID=8083 RepID=A0A3B5Q4K3_XIPMA